MTRRAVVLACLPVLLLVPALRGDAAWQSHVLLPGTDFATWYYTWDTGVPGPRVLLFAPHSDEQSAGQFLSGFVATTGIRKGLLVVCPWPVAPARKINTRSYIEDINRQFGPGSDNNTAIDLIAHHVKRWIDRWRISFVLNLHEGWGKFRDDWQTGYGQSFFIDTPAVQPVAERIAFRANLRVVPENRFVIVQQPMPTTLTWYCSTIGVPAIGVEVERGLEIGRRITYQRIVVEEALGELGLQPFLLGR